MARAISVTQLYGKKRKVLKFDGKWREAIGEPELAGNWIVWGKSGHGKTSFVVQLTKYLSKWSRVLYNSLEEGDSLSLVASFRRQNMDEVKRRVIILDKEPIAELRSRLKKPKAPRIVVIDSAQYTFLTIPEYFDLKKEFPNILFIWISHEKAGEPKGLLAQNIWYDAMVKIRVHNYRANVHTSRYLEKQGTTIDVWAKKAAELHGEMF